MSVLKALIKLLVLPNTFRRRKWLNHHRWIALEPLWPYFARVIALLDYGSGNLRSVHKALLKVGADVHIAQTPAEMADADAVVLPGVGAFDDCIHALRKQELLEASKKFIESGK